MIIRAQNQKLARVLLTLLFSVNIALCSPSQGQQQGLAATLTSAGEEQRMDAVAQLIGLFNALPNTATPQTYEALARALQSDNSPVIRALSARALENCCGEQAVTLLVVSLTAEREIAVRKAVLYALASHRLPQITPALIPLLRDKQQEIRAAAAFALAEIGDLASEGALTEILQRRRSDGDVFTRSQAARGLGKIGSRASIDILLNSLVHDKSQEVRRESAQALGLIANQQDAKVVEALHHATLEPDPYLTDSATKALERIRLRNP